ncbi:MULTISPECIES: molybdenum cofactor biosynthesis F family protein [Amycolatopsis]|uniref:Molybdenum cofactor biosynthesis protein F n=1 Tax=Amycolatopsis bullii TaxID=941987 RepID=A0ABQ3K758_9PSEU|nr:molybdenum cofactor biosynthesis F family protein [Amycolatopsis bullii]GHG03748.1 molybdenum cofactor biosynthesis protein F [Amycolatopsis bullii]
MTDLSDTANWLPLDGLESGFDANKAEPSTALADREIVVTDDRGTRITHRFGADTVGWDYAPGDTDPLPAATGTDHYEAFDVAEGLVYAQFHHTHEPNEAVSLFLDFTTGHTLSVITTIAEPQPGRTRVRQVFVPGHIDGMPVSGPAPAPTTALIGRRALWVYSEDHAYEHVYLSPQWYTWQCLAGPERGLADTDENTAYQLRPGIYVFTWREKVIPCAAVTVADHRNAHDLRSHGALFGLDQTGQDTTHFTFGAFGRLLSTTVHPAHLDPAQPGGDRS